MSHSLVLETLWVSLVSSVLNGHSIKTQCPHIASIPILEPPQFSPPPCLPRVSTHGATLETTAERDGCSPKKRLGNHTSPSPSWCFNPAWPPTYPRHHLLPFGSSPLPLPKNHTADFGLCRLRFPSSYKETDLGSQKVERKNGRTVTFRPVEPPQTRADRTRCTPKTTRSCTVT